MLARWRRLHTIPTSSATTATAPTTTYTIDHEKEDSLDNEDDADPGVGGAAEGVRAVTEVAGVDVIWATVVGDADVLAIGGVIVVGAVIAGAVVVAWIG